MASRLPSSAAIYDCVVIGAGPAGMAAATHLKRSGHHILLLEKNTPGGLLNNAHQVENYLGFLKIPGSKLVSQMKAHLGKWAIPCRREEVLEVVRIKNFEIRGTKNVYRAKTVLIATGTSPKQWAMASRNNFQSNIFYDWKKLERKLGEKSRVNVGIIGGGDLAFDYALHLKTAGQEPFIFVRNKASCLPLLLQRAHASKLKIFENTEIKHLERQGKTLLLRSTKGNFEVNSVLVAIGREITSPKTPPKNTPGLYFAGDVQNMAYRQAAIAAGDGLKAAMQISEFLSPQE